MRSICFPPAAAGRRRESHDLRLWLVSVAVLDALPAELADLVVEFLDCLLDSRLVVSQRCDDLAA